MDSANSGPKTPDKKQNISSSEVSTIFFAFLVVTIFVIFLFYAFVSTDNTMGGVGILFVVFIFTIVGSLIIKAIVLSGDRDVNINDFGNISLTSFISVFLIVGSTILSSKSLPIIGRSFENTVGYWWIKTFGDLSAVTKTIFTNTNNTDYDYNLIVTQVFDDNDRTLFDNNLRKQASKFKDVTVNTSDTSNIDKLYELVKRKHSISEATLVSLATIVALYTCFLPIKYPWIRGS